MKNKRLLAESLMVACYIFDFYHLAALCRNGGSKRHLLWIFLGLLVFSAALIYLQLTDAPKIKSRTAFVVKCSAIVCASILFVSSIVYSAIPYNGALSWKLDSLVHDRQVKLKHDNIYEDGLQGILDDLDTALHLPQKLYISEQFTIDFQANGSITAIEGFLYGKNDQGDTKTYLISYTASKSDKITVTMDGYTTTDYSEDSLLSPMEDLMTQASWQDQVKTWQKTYGSKTYELLYLGSRSFDNKNGLVAVSGNAGEIEKLDGGGSVKGYELSLHMPDDDQVTPIRYMLDPQYFSIEDQKAQTDNNTKDMTTNIGKSYTDENGALCFFITDTTGWRFKIIDAAAGSRFYGLQKTNDGGQTWNMINEDPFVGMIGVTEGLVFFDENNGIIGLTNAGGDWSYLYRTEDSGQSFTQIEFPGATTDEYYYEMPRQDKGQLVVLARSASQESSGVKYISTDGGLTWENAGEF